MRILWTEKYYFEIKNTKEIRVTIIFCVKTITTNWSMSLSDVMNKENSSEHMYTNTKYSCTLYLVCFCLVPWCKFRRALQVAYLTPKQQNPYQQ